MRLRFGLAALCLALGAASACLSPTLPLPPPDEPDTIFQGQEEGHWTIVGTCVEGAEVIVLNQRTGRGAVFLDREEDGAYAVDIVGVECDLISITQSLGAEPGNSTSTLLRAVEDGLEEDPNACR